MEDGWPLVAVRNDGSDDIGWRDDLGQSAVAYRCRHMLLQGGDEFVKVLSE